MADQWNEELHCPQCRNTGMASLSQPNDAAMPTVVRITDGFHRVWPGLPLRDLRYPGGPVRAAGINSGTIPIGGSWFIRKDRLMMIYRVKIAPPLVPLSDEQQANDEQMKIIGNSIADEDRWVKNFIDRLAGVVQDLKH
jgi:hypothetical protein